MKKPNFHMDKLGKDPSFDWYFSLACFAAVLIVVAAIDFWMYGNLTSADQSQGSAAVSSANILNKKDIGDVADKIRTNNAVSSSPSIPDPSL